MRIDRHVHYVTVEEDLTALKFKRKKHQFTIVKNK